MAYPYDEVIDELSKDPEFLTLDEGAQDKLIEELSQDRYGKIPHYENFIQKAAKSSQNITNNMGDFAEGFMDTRTLGGTALARNATHKFTDNTLNQVMGTPDYKRPEQERTPGYAVGAGVQSARNVQQLAKGGLKLLSPKTFARKELPGATGKLSESIQEVFKRSKADPKNLGVPKDEVVKILKEEFSKSKVPSGTQAALFRRWIKTLEGMKGKHLTADIISEMETTFGHAAKFGRDAGSNPILAQGAKTVNRFASTKVDEIAKKSGVPEFISRSLEKSKLLSTISKKPSLISRLARKAVEGAATAGGGYGGYKVVKEFFD